MNQEHLGIAKAGASSIQNWRDSHPGTVLDLSHADLRSAVLRTADLSGCNLFSASLWDADLREVNLQGSDLTLAYISEANLTGANLRDAKLYSANLSMDAMIGGTKLVNADLTGAKLGGASVQGSTLVNCVLDGADLSGTIFVDSDLSGVSCQDTQIGETIFANVDLSNVKGLLTVKHMRPSSLSIDTVLKSRGKIPDEFLRGCGYDPIVQRLLLGDISSIRPPVGKIPNLQLQSCFISYSSKDKSFADRLREELNKAGVNYWYAPEHGKWGQPLTEQIGSQIKQRDRVLLICSQYSLSDSHWVQWELESALREEKARRKRIVFPIMIDDTLLEWNHPVGTVLREILAGDFRGATQGTAFAERVRRLIAGLES